MRIDIFFSERDAITVRFEYVLRIASFKYCAACLTDERSAVYSINIKYI